MVIISAVPNGPSGEKHGGKTARSGYHPDMR